MTTEYESGLMIGEEEVHTPWSEEFALQIAMANGVGELTEAHWRVIHTLREHFIQYGAMPPMEMACSLSSLDTHCTEQLFHSANELWQVAGLPEPGSGMVAV